MAMDKKTNTKFDWTLIIMALLMLCCALMYGQANREINACNDYWYAKYMQCKDPYNLTTQKDNPYRLSIIKDTGNYKDNTENPDKKPDYAAD